MKHTMTEPLKISGFLPTSVSDELPFYIGDEIAGIAHVEMRHGRSFVVATVDETSRRRVQMMLAQPAYKLTMGKC